MEAVKNTEEIKKRQQVQSGESATSPDAIDISDDAIAILRAELPFILSKKRAAHVLGVERMAVRLGEIFMPSADDIRLLRAAALLHDITKELTVAEHFEILQKHGITPTPADALSPKTLHARTAALLIPERYPGLADPRVIDAVRYHTTGRAGMSMAEKIIYFADYIDDTRTYPDCVRLRDEFFDAHPDKMSAAERVRHLDRLMVMSFDMTIGELIERGSLISAETTDARNYLICELTAAGNTAVGQMKGE